MTLLKTEILKAFLENVGLFESMRNCTHFDDADKPNPYHLEGDVWTHTMMTYNQADPDHYIELIMALCHDIGKVVTRKVNPENGKVSFYGHSDASIQPTIDFVWRLYNKGILNNGELGMFMKYGLPAVGNHIIYYHNLHKLHYFANNNLTLKSYYERMGEMDGAGSICKIASIKDSVDGLVLKDFVKKEINPKLPTITIWTGLPGSGKDYLAEQNGNAIVSWDDIRVEFYKENNKKIGGWQLMSQGEIYANAFQYCNDNKVDINKIMRRKVSELLKTEKEINICNTSLTRKARRSIINTIGTKYNYIIKQVFVPSEIMYKRNNTRDSKTVPVNVIDNMMKHMTVATHFEKHVNEIQYILNV